MAPKLENNAPALQPTEPPSTGEFLGGALKGAVGMAITGAIALGAVGAAVAYGSSFTPLADPVVKALSNIIPSNFPSLTTETFMPDGTLGGVEVAKGAIAGAGAAVSAAVGAVLGAPAGAMAGLLGVRQKFVEEQVIPQIATVAIEKGKQIGAAQQHQIDMVNFETEKQTAHAQAGIVEMKDKPVVGKWTGQLATNQQAAQLLAETPAQGRA